MTATATAPVLGDRFFTSVAAGCRCDICPLANETGRGPVPPTLPEGYEFLVVAEAPGGTEVQQGKPLIGASGREVRMALQNANVDPNRVGYTNAIQCQPPGGNLKNYLRLVKKQGQVSPIDCCKPRLDREISQAKYVMLLGSASLAAAGVKGSVMQLRGTPLQLPHGVQALATPHPAFVLRDEGRVMRPVFHADITKAVRLAYGGNTWQDPWYFVPKTAAEVENFLNRQTGRTATDVETDGIDTWTCRLRRIGIGTDREVMIYSPLSVKGHAMLPAYEIEAQARAIAAYYQRAPRLDTHNGIVFDSVVLYRHGMPLPDDRVADTLVGHQVGPTSELPHGLDFLASIYTDAPRWKDDVKHSSVHDDAVLDKYLSFDIATTYQCAPYVEQNIIQSQQGAIYTLDAELFRIGRAMSALGLYVDQAARMKFAAEYQEKSARLQNELNTVAGREVNPNSPLQVRKLLFEDLGLPMLEEHYTDSGDPSTDESTLLDLLSMGLDERGRKVIQGILGCREAEKILGTYTGHIVDGKLVGGPTIHADGCVRPVWRPGKRSGRWGSNDPNAQNIIKKLRAMYVAKPGNILVAADAQAQELRMIAMLAGDEPLIQAFTAFDAGKGPDVHIFNACTVFNCRPDQVEDKVRNFIKRFVYALNYDAEPPRIYQTLSLLRDENLKPMFPNITLAEVQRLYGLWWQLHPAIPAWKKQLIYSWRSHKYIATRLGGRKRFFIGGEKATEMPNHDVQGSSAAMQNEAIKQLVAAYPFDFVNHRGLLVNGHDQLVVECAEHEGESVKKLVEACMDKTVGGMRFPAKAGSGRSWKDVS